MGSGAQPPACWGAGGSPWSRAAAVPPWGPQPHSGTVLTWSGHPGARPHVPQRACCRSRLVLCSARRFSGGTGGRPGERGEWCPFRAPGDCWWGPGFPGCETGSRGGCSWRWACGLSLSRLGQPAPLRRFPQPASRCARPGRPEIFPQAAGAWCRLRRRSLFVCPGNILAARPAGVRAPPARRCHLTAGKGPPVPRPPPGRPSLPGTAPGGTP